MSRADEEHKYIYNESHSTVNGAVVTCTCGRKLYVDAVSVMARTIPSLNASCLECLVVDEGFREAHPDIAAKIDTWKLED